MVTAQAQRTLVKSPPELWTELSDPVALERHLGELGEITITRIEPERKVEWQTDGARGVVELMPSGWGTKVTLSLTRETPSRGSSEATPAEAATASQRAEHVAEEPTPPRAPDPAPDAPTRAASANAYRAAPAADTPAADTPAAGAKETSGDASTETAADLSPAPRQPDAGDMSRRPADLPTEPSQPTTSRSGRGLLARLMARLRRRPATATSASAAPAPTPSTSSAETAPAEVPTPDQETPRPAATVAQRKAQRKEAKRLAVGADLLESLVADGTAAPNGEPPHTASERPATEAPPSEVQPPAKNAAADSPVPPSGATPQPSDQTAPSSLPTATAVTATDERAPAAGEAPTKPTTLTEEQGTELLRAVLDRLGEAHHRPFSRA